MTPTWRTPSGIGSTPGTTAGETQISTQQKFHISYQPFPSSYFCELNCRHFSILPPHFLYQYQNCPAKPNRPALKWASTLGQWPVFFLTLKKGVWGSIKRLVLEMTSIGFLILWTWCVIDFFDLIKICKIINHLLSRSIGFYVGIILSLSIKTSILWFPGSAAWTSCLSKPSRSMIG